MPLFRGAFAYFHCFAFLFLSALSFRLRHSCLCCFVLLLIIPSVLPCRHVPVGALFFHSRGSATSFLLSSSFAFLFSLLHGHTHTHTYKQKAKQLILFSFSGLLHCCPYCRRLSVSKKRNSFNQVVRERCSFFFFFASPSLFFFCTLLGFAFSYCFLIFPHTIEPYLFLFLCVFHLLALVLFFLLPLCSHHRAPD
jgi:hypothetical protein